MSEHFANGLLRRLSTADLQLLLPYLAPVELPLKMRLETPRTRIKYVYFLESGIASSTYGHAVPGAREVEVGMTGREGMTGISILLEDDESPNSTFMQLGGGAQRIEAGYLRAVMEQSPSLRRLFMRFVQAMFIQSSQTTFANRDGTIDQRLARWLLMTADRNDSRVVEITHEFLGTMLGVRRAGVTEAMHELEASNLVRGHRGHVEVVSRPGLVKLAGATYGIAEVEYNRLIRIPLEDDLEHDGRSM
jgi:CRP-like cAMP-binding protein